MIVKDVVIRCDAAGCTVSLATFQQSISAARRIAREQGWQTAANHLDGPDYCLVHNVPLAGNPNYPQGGE